MSGSRRSVIVTSNRRLARLLKPVAASTGDDRLDNRYHPE